MSNENEKPSSDSAITVPLQLRLVWGGVCSIQFSGTLLLSRSQTGALSLALEDWSIRAGDNSED